MDPRRVFEENLGLIERVIAHVVRKGRLVAEEAEDFASTARLALMEDDYAILAQYDGRAPLGAYLAIVLYRILCDERNRQFGRWRPSAEAKRMGDAGVLLEQLLRRDQRPLREAAAIVASAHASLTDREIESMAARLPERAPRLRAVVLDEADEETLPGIGSASARVDESEQLRIAATTADVVRDELAAMSVEDRFLVRMHFGASMAISGIARIMGVPQRPLYRRIEALLGRLRKALGAAGIAARDVETIVGSSVADLDLGLTDGKNGCAGPYLQEKAGE